MNSVTEFSETDDPRAERRRRGDSYAGAKTLGMAVVVIGLVGSIFTAGYNWRSVAIVESNQEQFVRKDVQDQQIRNMTDRLNEISKQLEEVRVELNRQRR